MVITRAGLRFINGDGKERPALRAMSMAIEVGRTP